MSGKALIFSAPSGAGKTTLVQHVMSLGLNLHFSVSVCSRAPRPNEINGKDYFFVSPDEFRKLIENQQLVEWQEVYPDHFYGTTRQQVQLAFAKGHNLIFDVDVLGGLNLKKEFGDAALSIFIHPGTIDVLENRLRNRQSDSNEKIRQRLEKADFELSFAKHFDVVVLNDSLGDAKRDVEEIVSSFLFANAEE